MDDGPGAQVASDLLDAGIDARTSETLPPADPPTSPSSADALARFEFEKGKANEGTKILMIEWKASLSDESSSPKDHEGWEVEFEGKAASFPLSEEDDSGTRRVYFLIAPQVTIPPSVTISQQRTGRKLVTKSMPAIFAPGLGVDSKDAGKRGVLHTLWAKKRLSQLQEEIRKELQDNSEGIGLEMALQERQWIVDHFGLEQSDIGQQTTTEAAATAASAPPLPPTPQTPRSPIGGRLGERLRGLKLATSSSDLRGNIGTNSNYHAHAISPPESSGPAGGPARSALTPNSHVVSVAPGAAVASLDAMLGNDKPVIAPEGRDTEEELFALPMSPRSPEMTTSPFSLLK
ncbi:hypothetical protein SLS62_000222 [Diatrype stigma]|uniref:Uncharacterized protein n=1 Tax=Diatrype stigma TaxID=117547 RepID=A0AAN9VB01_9PEZI